MRPMEVPYGVESYIDETESAGWIYYFVAASNDGQNSSMQDTGIYINIIPLDNTLAVNVRFEESEFPAFVTAAPARSESKPESKPGISGLKAAISGEGVTISYQTGETSRDTVLYRSVQPIQKAEDLLRAVIVQSGLIPPFIDYPVPGISYYYAVIFEDDLPRGSVQITPGVNATTEAVAVSSGSGRVGLPGAPTELRSMPLPLMALNYAVPGIDSFAELSAPIPLGRDAARAVSTAPNKGESKIAMPKKPRAFSEDLNENSGSPGEEYGLKTIVQGPFLNQDWKTVITEMRRYLSLPRGEITEARARFYLGQSLYFSASYQEALIEFLMVRAQFPNEANEWIEAALAQLINR
jgi:hypothetical protein